MQDKVQGTLIIIGGNEDKKGDCRILKRFVEMSGGDNARIAIITTATEQPEEVGTEYKHIFHRLGAGQALMQFIDNREAADNDEHTIAIETATGIFFTGGDQLRLTSILGGSRVNDAIHRALTRGIVIAGTSAGASVMSDTMIIGGNSSDTPKKETLSMSPGMGLLKGVVIDQHFAQRGRINRLLSAVAQNPHVLGVGIDEDTAFVVNSNAACEVLGAQAVTVIDASRITYSNISELQQHDPLAIMNVVLHVLPNGYGYDLLQRKPYQIFS